MPGYANPQNLNRYSYVSNNPLRFIDPTGHMLVENEGGGGCSTSGYCGPVITSPSDEDEAVNNDEEESNNSPQDEPDTQCSVILISCQLENAGTSFYYTMSSLAYPKTPVVGDKMGAELTPLWWVSLISLLPDLASIASGSDFVAKHITHENAYAIVQYEVRKGVTGNTPYITSFKVVNNTNSSISVLGFKTDLHFGQPSASTYIQPGTTTNVMIMPKPIVAYSITINLSNNMAVTAHIAP